MVKMEINQRRLDNFWRKVDKTPGQGPKGDCWIWKGGLLTNGYGTCRFGEHILVHRASFEITYGPTNLQVLHSCDNRPCVNPDHLWDGTQSQNLIDCYQKKRRIPPSHTIAFKRTIERRVAISLM